MSYVESFTRAMERARQSVSYWDRKTLDHLQAAHDAEMRQCSKSEYHRGYEDGKAARDADQWQVDRERAKVIEAVKKVVPEGYFGSHNMLSEICRAIYSPVFGWTAEAGRDLCNRLIELMGGKTTNSDAETSSEVIENGEKYQLDTYDVLGNERHKVVCRLRKFEPWIGGKPTEEASKLIRCIIGREDCHVACGSDLEEARDRLIHLLGGDDGTASNDDRTCPIAVQSPSITDELRKWASGDVWSRKWDEFDAIADRIDAQFERICEQHESVLQQTISDTVDEHEQEMAELRHDVEMWRDRAEDMRLERDDLRAELRVANQTHECNRKLAKRNEQWCDALLDLIRDAAEDYQTAARVARRLQERTSELRRERDELQDRLQAISVLCEQDDG